MADSRIYLSTQPILSTGNPLTGTLKAASVSQGSASFADVLHQVENKVSFSQHAIERMQSRNLDFSEQDLGKLDVAVEKMAQKGAKESLIYLHDIALVVSVTNKTVITAIDGASAKENIFTNIDSAAIL
jgi:flagellar operon protein